MVYLPPVIRGIHRLAAWVISKFNRPPLADPNPKGTFNFTVPEGKPLQISADGTRLEVVPDEESQS